MDDYLEDSHYCHTYMHDHPTMPYAVGDAYSPTYRLQDRNDVVLMQGVDVYIDQDP